MRAGKLAFTLVEMLVVIAIIVALVAMLLPALVKARKSAIQAQCMSNLRQIAMGAIMYANDNHGIVAGVKYPNNVDPDGDYYTSTLFNGTGTLSYAPFDGSAASAGPVGMGILLYTGYLKDLKACYCPGRTGEEYSSDTNLDYSARNVGAPALTYNAGWKKFGPNVGIAGYLIATSDSGVTKNGSSVWGNNVKYDFSKWHKLGRCAFDTPLVMDIPFWEVGQPRGFVFSGHGRGYSIALFDGSVAFYPDKDDILETHFGNHSVPTNWASLSASGWFFSFQQPSRWNYVGTGNSTGLAWIEHYMLGWGDARIKNNTPDP